MKKIIILSIILLTTAYSTNAQTADRKWSVGIHGGANQYLGDLGFGFYRFDKGFYGFGGISVSRYLNTFFDLTIEGNYGRVGYFKSTNNLFHAGLIGTNLITHFKFLGNDKAKFSPYIFLGIGYMRFNDLNTKEVWHNIALPACGIGLTYHVTPVISLQLEERYIYSNYDNVDHSARKADDSYLQHELGILFNFGKAKDTDKDGIPDKEDKCPTEKGLLKFEGCPDTDNDGVPDKDDKCAATPSGVKVDAQGCPLDTDGDEIADYLDKCPTEKGIGKFEGCPDTDNDGVADKDDKCPNTPAGVKVDIKGCPLDTDGDNIADYLDNCPDVKGTAENKGCPEIKKEITQKTLQGIQFETGKDVIRPVSFKVLIDVAVILKENKESKLIINGYTDNVGKPESNMILSQKRADAVKAYFVKNGVGQAQLKAVGYGDAKPIGDNNTEAGRAKNRRVEFIVEE